MANAKKRNIKQRKNSGRDGNLLLFELTPVSSSEPEIPALAYPIWTKSKARLIQAYLFLFVQITKHGTYIDGFAGPQDPKRTEAWAAKLVLESEPRWFRHFYLCDIKPVQIERLEALRTNELDRSGAEPTRDIRVLAGDFNILVSELLDSGEITPREATFCLLDQRTFECHWETIRKLATYKQSEYKIELFYFLPIAWLDRALHATKETFNLQAWWGRHDWDTLRGLRPERRAEIVVNRFKEEFDYKSVKAWPIYGRQGGGRVMYYMIHATDHPVAPGLMYRAYEQAVRPKATEIQLGLDLSQSAVEVGSEESSPSTTASKSKPTTALA